MKSKQSKSAPVKAAVGRRPRVVPEQCYVDRNLMGVSPLKEQFEPTPAEPVRQRARMAGAC